MHDPSILLLDIPVIRLDVWHDEPGGHDAGEVCGYPPSTRRTIPRVVWAVRHVRHLHYRWWPYLKVRRWLVDRCADCGRRFRWKDSRHGYQSSDKVWHDVCMSLRHVRSQPTTSPRMCAPRLTRTRAGGWSTGCSTSTPRSPLGWTDDRRRDGVLVNDPHGEAK